MAVEAASLSRGIALFLRTRIRFQMVVTQDKQVGVFRRPIRRGDDARCCVALQGSMCCVTALPQPPTLGGAEFVGNLAKNTRIAPMQPFQDAGSGRRRNQRASLGPACDANGNGQVLSMHGRSAPMASLLFL